MMPRADWGCLRVASTGYPTANTVLRTRAASALIARAGGSAPSTASTAMSLALSSNTTRAGKKPPSPGKRTTTWRAPSTTCCAVTISPSSATNPDPCPAVARAMETAWPPASSIWWTPTVPTVNTRTVDASIGEDVSAAAVPTSAMTSATTRATRTTVT